MKKNFIKLIISTIVSLCLIFCINYFVDPYGIFSRKYQQRKTPINERFIKTKYIINNPMKYDSFIFGSSRVGTLKGEKLKIGNFYNMTFSGAIPSEIFSILKNFEEENIKIKNIILGIDDFDLYTDPKTTENILYKLSYDNLKLKRWEIYKNYLLINPFNRVTYEHFFGKNIVNFDIENTGKCSSPFKEIEIEENPQKHCLSNVFEKKSGDKNLEPRINHVLDDINAIIKFCNNKNIKITIIFLPLHKTTFLQNNLENLTEFKKRLQLLTSYWDFVSLNEFTENNYYWYETSHYRPMLGDLILKKIYKDDFNLKPKLIDEKNVFGEMKKKIEL